jgi:hypothetical protein
MADDLDTGTAGTPTPETPPPSPQYAALSALAKSGEDATRYIEERQSQEADDQDIEPERPTNGDARADRIEQSLEQARERSRQAREIEGQLDKGLEQAEAEWAQQQQQERMFEAQRAAELTHAEQRGKCMAYFEDMKRKDPVKHQRAYQHLAALPDVLDDAQSKVIENGLIYYPEVMIDLAESLADDTTLNGMSLPDKMAMLAGDSPEALWQGIQQQAQVRQVEKYVQTRVAQELAARSRRVTSAPPPFRMPNGAANPPKDLYREANKTDASDYIRMRKIQMQRDAED